MNINKLRYYKIPVKQTVKFTIISNNNKKIIRSNMTVNQEKKLIALIDDELWILPNHKALRDLFGRFGAGTEVVAYRRNKGVYNKLEVRYDFKLITEVSNKTAQKMIKQYGDEQVFKMIVNRQFYKELDKSSSNQFYQDLLLELSN